MARCDKAHDAPGHDCDRDIAGMIERAVAAHAPGQLLPRHESKR
jgi:hypothetical protein